MTDNDTPQQDAPSNDGTPPPAETPPQPPESSVSGDESLGEGGKKALQAERDARKAAEKANADLSARLKAFEDRDKTEVQRLTEARDAAEQAARESATELLRYRVAAEKQVDADLLAGSDEESMRAHADRLLAWRGPANGQDQTRAPAPRPDLSQGARGQADTIDAQIEDAEAKGDFRTAILLKARKQVQSTATK